MCIGQWQWHGHVSLDNAGVPVGDNSTHKGEVLAFDAEKGQHLVFYDDGEDEWVDLSLQHVTWQEHVRGVTVAHGLPAGDSLPAPHMPPSFPSSRDCACRAVWQLPPL